MPEVKISPALKKAFADFLEYTPAQRLSRNLRDMLVYYILSEKDGVPPDIEDLLCDLLQLFHLLDIADEEWGRKSVL